MLSPFVSAYLLSASVVFAIALNAFLRDREVSKTRAVHWLFITSLAICAPLTLPMILTHRCHKIAPRTPAPRKFRRTPTLRLRNYGYKSLKS